MINPISDNFVYGYKLLFKLYEYKVIIKGAIISNKITPKITIFDKNKGIFVLFTNPFVT